jgi:hypothetical protein
LKVFQLTLIYLIQLDGVGGTWSYPITIVERRYSSLDDFIRVAVEYLNILDVLTERDEQLCLDG